MDLPVIEFDNLRVSEGPAHQANAERITPPRWRFRQPDYSYATADIKDYHFYRLGMEDLAGTAIQTSFPLYWSIEHAPAPQLMRWYNRMPTRYQRLSAEELLEWGRTHQLPLPDLQTLTDALVKEDCNSYEVYDLIQSYMVQFNWVRIHEDSRGRYTIHSPDRLR